MTSIKIKRSSKAATLSPLITVINDKDGGVGWRIAGEQRDPKPNGKKNPGKKIFGKIYGVEEAAAARSPAYQLSVRVIENALRGVATERQAAGKAKSTAYKGRALPVRTSGRSPTRKSRSHAVENAHEEA